MKPDITGIRKRLEAARPGPWRRTLNHIFELDDGIAPPIAISMVDYKDAELIARALTDLASLLAYVSELEGQLKIAVEGLIEISKDTVELTPWKSQASNPAIIANEALEKIDERFRK